MLREFISLENILQAFENTLYIEYLEPDVENIIKSSIARLENAYKVRFDTTLEELQTRSNLVSDSANILISQIVECLKQLSYLTQLTIYSKSVQFDLAEVNYLGFAKEQLKVSLRYMMDDNLSDVSKSAMDSIQAALSNIDVSNIKRLFTILLMLNKLGVDEGVAIVANYIYLGVLT